MNLFQLTTFIARHPLNRNGKMAALSRFLRWQLASRLLPAPVAVEYVSGTRLLMQRGMTGATGNWYCGLHELEEMAFVLHSLRPGDLFGDIGANVGSYTILAGGAVGADVLAIEPLPATFAKLQANIRLNDIAGRVQAECCGLSSERGEISFVSSLDTMNRIALPDETLPTIRVPVTTLDRLCGNRRPRVVKIDVEGHELQVLNGAATTLASNEVEAVLMETNASGVKFGISDEALVKRMAAFGFKTYRYDPYARQLSFSKKGELNTIFVKDAASMTARCQAAPRYSLVNGLI